MTTIKSLENFLLKNNIKFEKFPFIISNKNYCFLPHPDAILESNINIIIMNFLKNDERAVSKLDRITEEIYSYIFDTINSAEIKKDCNILSEKGIRELSFLRVTFNLSKNIIERTDILMRFINIIGLYICAYNSGMFILKDACSMMSKKYS